MLPFDSLENLLTSEFGFGLTTATPLQRAICWLIECGRVPDRLWDVPAVQESFGGVRPTKFSPEILLLCGVRSAKTLISAAACVWKALTADLSSVVGLSMRKGERPSVSLVSRGMQNAREAMNYIVGAVTTSPFLRPFLVGKPKADWVTLQHPSGTEVVVRVIAMSASGVTLVSRWVVSVLFDEAPRMGSEDENLINLEEQRRAVLSRLLPGGVILYVGSPFGAKGYVYTLYQSNWQRGDAKVPVVKAFAFNMNPVWWTTARCRELEERDPDAYRNDVLAEFRDPEEQLYSNLTLDQIFARTALVIPYDSSKRYTAVMDPGESNNAWTLVIGNTPDNRRFVCDYACEWRGSKTAPLRPKEVLIDAKERVGGYGISTVLSDQFMASALVDIGSDIGLGISPIKWTAENKTKYHLTLHARALEGCLDLPPIPEMRRDFIYLKRRLTANGDTRIVLTETQDGRHCDFASALAMLCGYYLDAYSLDSLGSFSSQLRAYNVLSGEELEELEDELAERDWLYDDEPHNAREYWE